MTPSRPRLQYLLPKINTMASCPSRIHHQLISFFVSNPRHHALLNASAFIRGIALLPNDDVLPTADASTECFEENLLPNGVLLPNSAQLSVSSPYQFLVLTPVDLEMKGLGELVAAEDGGEAVPVRQGSTASEVQTSGGW
jgi:hypothetical protein